MTERHKSVKEALTSREDIYAAPLKRKRTRRPPWPEKFRPSIDAAREHHQTRPASPGVRLDHKNVETFSFESPFQDREAWEVLICNAFGTRSHCTYQVFLDQLTGLCEQVWREEGGDGRWSPDEFQLNAALAIINGAQPRNEVEACLVAQMVAIHFATMKLSKRALQNGSYLLPTEAALMGRLARTYAIQLETLGKMQGKVRRQKITVRYEKHNHHHQHLHHHHEGGSDDFRSQAHVPTREGALVREIAGGALIEHAPGAAMPCEDPERESLPRAEGEGQAPVSAPWGRARLRRTTG